jgi:predicted XRE-type DNA-binding protein
MATNPITRSSGNVFQDLGLPDSVGLMAKAQLTQKLARIIERRKLSQAQVAKLLEIDQPKISMLLRGRFDGFSIERLMRLLTALEQNVKIVVTPARLKETKSVTLVAKERYDLERSVNHAPLRSLAARHRSTT